MSARTRRRNSRMILASIGGKTLEIAAHAPVQIKAAATDGAAPVVSIEAYTGNVMTVAGIGPVVVDIAGIEAGATVTLLADHENRLGSVMGTSRIRKDRGSLFVDGTLSKTNEFAKLAVSLSQEGVALEASIGAEPIEAKRVTAGTKVNVNNREITAGAGGFLLVSRSRLRHIAIVPNGADGATSVSIAAWAATLEGSGMNEFQKYVESLGFVLADLNEAQVKALKSQHEKIVAGGEGGGGGGGGGEPEGGPGAGGSGGGTGTGESPEKIAAAGLQQIRATYANETNRIVGIKKLCAAGHEEIEAKAIAEGWDLTKTELEVVRASRPTPAIHIAENKTDNVAVLEASLALNVGLKNHEKLYKAETLERAEKFRRRGLRWTCETLCASLGRPINEDPGSNAWIQAAFSTQELSGILGNIAHKALQNAFTNVPSIAEQICGVKSHGNFHKHTVYSFILNGSLQPVAPDGTLKHLQMSEEGRERQLDTKGAILAITRKDILNDDLNVFADNANALGRVAVDSREEAVFTALNGTGAGASFFTTANANYAAGAGTRLSSTSMSQAVQMFRQQKKPDGKPANISPKILLTTSADESMASKLFLSEKVLGPTSDEYPDENIWKNKFAPMTSTWLEHEASGGLPYNWYLFADPLDVAVIELCYLNGVTRPIIEFFGINTVPDKLGAIWRVYYDFGVALAEKRGGVKMKGAA